MENMSLVSLIVLGLLVYFIPAIVAWYRYHRNKGAIVALNVLLGWTILGWVAALVWSLMSTQTGAPTRTDLSARKCPWCAELIKSEGLPLLWSRGASIRIR